MSEDRFEDGLSNEPTTLESVKKLTRDLALAAKTLTDQEARYLVDAYYIMQEDRKRTGNQVLALGDSQEPNGILVWLQDQAATLEKQIARALDKYTQAHPMGEWMRGVYGIGPVLSAGLLAHIDITKAPTAGHIWRFAGLDPTMKWEKGQKRPWNASLKTLCWKIGQSFMKFSGKEECVYGKLYQERKKYELQRNDSGGNAPAALLAVGKVAKSTEAYKWLAGCYPLGTMTEIQNLETGKRGEYLKSKALQPGEGTAMLPPAQIDARARRWAVKIFISHLQQVWYKQHYGVNAPAPYACAILGHAHKIEPFN